MDQIPGGETEAGCEYGTYLLANTRTIDVERKELQDAMATGITNVESSAQKQVRLYQMR